MKRFAGIFFYALLTHLPEFAQVILLLVAIVVIYGVDPKRATKRYPALLFWGFPIALGLFCGAMWKMTGEDVWVRLGIACICMRASLELRDGRVGGPPSVVRHFQTLLMSQ